MVFFWSKVLEKFCAKIYHRSKSMYLGSFSTEKEAALRYDEEALKVKGQAAKLNFPERQETRARVAISQAKLSTRAEQGNEHHPAKLHSASKQHLDADIQYERRHIPTAPGSMQSPTSIITADYFFRTPQTWVFPLSMRPGWGSVRMPEAGKVFADHRGFAIVLI